MTTDPVRVRAGDRYCPRCGAVPGRPCGDFAGGNRAGRYRIRERWSYHRERWLPVLEPGIARDDEPRTGTGANLDLFALTGA